MPWFRGQSDGEKERKERAEADRQESLRAIEAGDIPPAAKQRLRELRAPSTPFFTSDFSVNEFLLSRNAGCDPVSQVMGSSVYHVGWQYMGRIMSTGELTVLSNAYNNARSLALGRLRIEAETVGAHAVVGLHIDTSRDAESSDLIHFQAIGTAVRFRQGKPRGDMALTNLSGADFWKLLGAGYWPAGILAASTVYYVVPNWSTRQATSGWGTWYNQELTDFTAGVYRARNLAISRMHVDVRTVDAIGVVGMSIDQEAETREVDTGNNNTRTDMIFTFHAVGTAITTYSSDSHPLVATAVNLKTDRRRSRRTR